MIRVLALTAEQMRDVEMYAQIEPVGEGMVDYTGACEPETGNRERPKPMNPDLRRRLLRAILPTKAKDAT